MPRSHSAFASAPRFLGLLAAAALAFVAPSIASALSTTLTLTDPGSSGLGATITIDDSLDPGNLSVSIVLNAAGSATGDLRSLIILDIQNDALYPGLAAAGSDVFSGSIWGTSTTPGDACACGIIVDFGTAGLLEPTGLQSTSFVLDHPTVALSLADLNGQTFWVAIGRGDATNDGSPYGGVLKLRTEPIQVVPEPSTAIMMLLGLSGLSLTSRRLARSNA